MFFCKNENSRTLNFDLRLYDFTRTFEQEKGVSIITTVSKMKKLGLYAFLLSSLLFSSCEDVIKIEVEPGETQLAVDAFVNNLEGEQKIILTKTAPYFENKPAPRVSGAEVFVEDLTDNVRFDFKEKNPGEYIYSSEAGKSFGKLKHNFKLTVRSEGQEYNAFSTANPTTKVDSIVVKFEKEALGRKEGYYAEMFARDLKGQRDYYWIKTYINGTFLGRPEYINIARDAVPGGSSAGTDGLTFIPPIRLRVTDFDTPYKLGDNIRVEIHSITADTHEYMAQVQNQILNGGIFAVQPHNVATNIKNANPKGKKAVGWFCVSQVESMSKTVSK